MNKEMNKEINKALVASIAPDESDSDAEDYFEKPSKKDEVVSAMLKHFIVPQWYKTKHIVERCKGELDEDEIEEIISIIKKHGHRIMDEWVNEVIEDTIDEKKRESSCW